MPKLDGMMWNRALCLIFEGFLSARLQYKAIERPSLFLGQVKRASGGGCLAKKKIPPSVPSPLWYHVYRLSKLIFIAIGMRQEHLLVENV